MRCRHYRCKSRFVDLLISPNRTEQYRVMISTIGCLWFVFVLSTAYWKHSEMCTSDYQVRRMRSWTEYWRINNWYYVLGRQTRPLILSQRVPSRVTHFGSRLIQQIEDHHSWLGNSLPGDWTSRCHKRQHKATVTIVTQVCRRGNVWWQPNTPDDIFLLKPLLCNSDQYLLAFSAALENWIK